MKKIASPKISIGFAIALVVLVINSIVAYQSINTAAKNGQAEIHSDEVLHELMQIELKLKDIEMGQREYALTNSNPAYLAARKSDIDRVRDRLKSLVALKSSPLTTKDPNLSRFVIEIDRHLDLLSATIDKRQAQILSPQSRIELSQSG
jgi:CHASE3 domain sensor protein